MSPGVEGAAANIVDLLAGCCEAAGCSTADLGAVVLGLAGAGSRPIREKLSGPDPRDVPHTGDPRAGDLHRDRRADRSGRRFRGTSRRHRHRRNRLRSAGEERRRDDQDDRRMGTDARRRRERVLHGCRDRQEDRAGNGRPVAGQQAPGAGGRTVRLEVPGGPHYGRLSGQVRDPVSRAPRHGGGRRRRRGSPSRSCRRGRRCWLNRWRSSRPRSLPTARWASCSSVG